MTQIDCTGDACTADILTWTEAVFSGSHRNPKYVGDRTVTALVLRESYGAAKQQHTFTLSVRASSGVNPLKAGDMISRKGRNIYRNGCTRLQWECEDDRRKIIEEKHRRGNLARAACNERISQS